MAIRVQPFYAVILRPFVSQEIQQIGWRTLVLQAARGAFDGEIMVFPAMNMLDVQHTVRVLERAGYRGAAHGSDADLAVFDRGEGSLPDWLEKVEVRHFDAPEVEDAAWKLKDSEVYTLHDCRDRPCLPTKGYEVDWEPFIGRISG